MTRSSETARSLRTWRPDGPFDLIRTLRPLQRGGSDPCHRVVAGAVWHTFPAPTGPVTLCLTLAGGAVQAQAWGEGAQWALDAVPDVLGARDEIAGFAPVHPLLRSVLRQHPGVRLGRTGLVFDQVVPAVLEQKVTGVESRRSWRELLMRFGSPAPGPAPAGMRVAPSHSSWLAVTDWDWHLAGVDLARRRAIRAAACVASRLEECVAMSSADALRRLMVVPGICPWTDTLPAVSICPNSGEPHQGLVISHSCTLSWLWGCITDVRRVMPVPASHKIGLVR